MAFSEDFTVSLSGSGTLIFTDASTGSDGTITERRIYLYKWDGTTIVPTGTTTAYIVWPISSSTYTLTDILDRDYALNVTVEAYTPTPTPGNTYTTNHAYCFVNYDNQFLYNLTVTNQIAYPQITQDTNYMMNKYLLRELVDDAEQAVSLSSDVTTAQTCLDAAYQMILNSSYYF